MCCVDRLRPPPKADIATSPRLVFAHPLLNWQYIRSLTVTARPVVDGPFFTRTGFAQDRGSVRPAAVKQQAACYRTINLVVLHQAQLIQNEQQAGNIPARIDAVHLTWPGLRQKTGPRDTSRCADLRSYSAIKPSYRGRHSAPLGLRRCTTGGEQPSKFGAISTAQTNLGTIGAAETMANCDGRNRG